MEQERINKNVNELSQKLLEGCKLLSESCPETNVPLVSTPDGRMYSVGNGCYYVRDGGSLVKISSSALPPPGSPPKPSSPERPSTFVSAATFSAPPGSVSMSHESPRLGDSDGQSLSSRVAAKLLEGFTLLSESCPVTSVPLVQDPHGRILSVGTGKWFERTGGQLVESLPVGSGSASTPAAIPYQQSAYTPSSHAAPVRPPSAVRPQGTPLMVPPSPFVNSNSAVASAILAATDNAPPSRQWTPSGPPAQSALPHRAAGVHAPTSKLAVQEAIAVLSSRLGEATAALQESSLHDAAAPVALIKDIALAIAALRAL